MPEPKTRAAGRPENCWAAYVTTSTGLVTTSSSASGARPHQRRHEVATHRDVGGGQVQPGLAGLLLGARP